MKIIDIDKNSPLYGKIPVGADLIAVNGYPVADEIDFHFYNTEDKISLRLDIDGRVKTLRLYDIDCGDLGLTFKDRKIKVCNNKCIFCFVHQQPKGMRRSLYIKDDDYCYSFTHGNYISLSGMTDDDFDRIIKQRLSPLYISVHTTDDDLRRRIFQNKRLQPILPAIQRLTDGGIILHTQTVICPGINDGAQLQKTITDLAAFAPDVASLAIVPVGLTRYRERLTPLRTYTGKEASQIIDLISDFQKRFLKVLGTRFVWAADEFYLLAKGEIPNLGFYEDLPQWENGVGIVREFITVFNRKKRYLPDKLKRPVKIEIVTGRASEPILKKYIIPDLRKIKRLRINLTAVDNNFWGETVTVTGLLTGKDIIRQLKGSNSDIILLPPNCLNVDGLFLDDVSLTEFEKKVNKPVLTGSYDIAALVKRAIEEVR
jgi:putative radical SAM enzyme (TIGR03279 family)